MADPKSCTVGKYLTVLMHELTRYDMAESARESRRGRPNIYRLGHLIEAKQKVEADVEPVAKRDDPEALDRLRSALYERFTEGFRPVDATLRQMDRGTCKIRSR